MAKTFVALTGVVGAVKLAWEDCGDADTHGIVTDLAPLSVDVGDTKLTGKGFLDEDTNAGTYSFTAKVGAVTILEGSGDLCSESTIEFPLNAGSLVFHGVECPTVAGEVSLDLDLNVLSSIASNDLVNIKLNAESDVGHKLLCMAITTDDGKLSAAPDCSKAVCPSQCECAEDKCADEINTCLADSDCASSQTCAMACACSDTACMLNCAAASPSSKALPVATCINSNCAATAAAPDCSKAVCPSQCECAEDKCADEINTCLADSDCASSQTCAMACACSDTACMLNCAAASPSSKALPVATCINSNCASNSVAV